MKKKSKINNSESILFESDRLSKFKEGLRRRKIERYEFQQSLFSIINPFDNNTIDWSIKTKNFNKKCFLSFNLCSKILSYPLKEVKSKHLLRIDQFQRLETLLISEYDVEGIKYPCISVTPAEIITRLRVKLMHIEGTNIQSIHIMGGVSSYIIQPDFPFNDLDILFNISFNFERRYMIFDLIRNQLCKVVHELLLEQSTTVSESISLHLIPAAYFQKQINVPPQHETSAKSDSDCWSLVCLRNLRGCNLEFKFVRHNGFSSIKRHFEFSSDSFQIVLDNIYLNRLAKFSNMKNLKLNYKISEVSLSLNKPLPKLPWFLPSVHVICLYPNFFEAIRHLNKKYIQIFQPADLRGGGLLKYCYLKVHNFRNDPKQKGELNKFLTIMTFLFTTSDRHQQWTRLVKYMDTHFPVPMHNMVQAASRYRDRLTFLQLLNDIVRRLNKPETYRFLEVITGISERIEAEALEKTSYFYGHQEVNFPAPLYKTHSMFSPRKSTKSHIFLKKVSSVLNQGPNRYFTKIGINKISLD